MQRHATPDRKLIEKKNYLIGGAVGAVVVAIIAAYFLSQSLVNTNDQAGMMPKAFAVDSDPYGTPYPEWVARWWQRELTIPASEHPRVDNTGDRCMVRQDDPNVWFLAGISEGSVERHCIIPTSKAIFIPVLRGECDYLSDSTVKTETDLRDCAWGGINGATYSLTLNGVKFTNLDLYRMESPVFDVTIPEDNVFGGGSVGPTQAVAVGYYVMLEPLPPGLYHIRYSSSLIDNPTLGTFVWAEDITYNIEIK